MAKILLTAEQRKHIIGDVNQLQSRVTAAESTLQQLGYTYHGGEQWKPPLGTLKHLTAEQRKQIIDTVCGASDWTAADIIDVVEATILGNKK